MSHFEFIPTGEALDQIADMSNSVRTGDILLSPEFVSHVSDSVILSDTPTPSSHKILVNLDRSVLQDGNNTLLPVKFRGMSNLLLSHQSILVSMCEDFSLQKIKSVAGVFGRTSRPSSKLRSRTSSHVLVTTVFVTLSSKKITQRTDDDVALSGLQEAFIIIYSSLRQFGGTLRQFVEDDKGLVAILIFSGLESTAISACRCALKIQEKFHAEEISHGIGLATGKVFYGPVGDERR